MDAAQVLLETELFGDLRAADLTALLPSVHPVSFARGELVWNEGDAATALYVVAEGQLKAYRVSREGAELILGVVRSGEIFGEVGLFHPSGVRRVAMGAMESTSCVTIEREPLLRFFAQHDLVMRRMLAALSEIAGRAAYTLTDLAFEDIRRRVARVLLDLAREQGEPSESGVRIRVKLSQATLAAMVSATRENVNRALAQFVTRGQVSQRGGFFFVHDRDALESVGESE